METTAAVPGSGYPHFRAGTRHRQRLTAILGKFSESSIRLAPVSRLTAVVETGLRAMFTARGLFSQ